MRKNHSKAEFKKYFGLNEEKILHILERLEEKAFLEILRFGKVCVFVPTPIDLALLEHGIEPYKED
ncbi:hypothetical protein V7166_20475 [Bacillus thuringiensis]